MNGAADSFSQLPEPVDPVICAVLEAWKRAHPGGGLLPGRQHIDPLTLPRLTLPHIFLFDVLREPDRLRFRYRLVGAHINFGMPGNKTGRYFDEVMPDDPARRATLEALTRCAEKGEVSYRRGKPRLPTNQEAALIERLYLPLAADGRIVDMLFCASVFFDANERPLRTGI